MAEESKKVTCGFRKWNMQVTDGVVRIHADHHPIYIDIDLHDASPDELIALGEMFIDAGQVK